MNKALRFGDFKFWRYLINFWTFLFFFFIIYDFLKSNAYTEVLNIMATIYIGALAVYASNKEFERWYDKHRGQHPGEIFVVLWTILVFFLFLAGVFKRGAYRLPGAIISSYIAVLTILAVTRKSKQLYRARHKK